MSSGRQRVAALVVSGPSRKPGKLCQGWTTSGYGRECFANASKRVGGEVACAAHVAQSIARQRRLTGIEHSAEGL